MSAETFDNIDYPNYVQKDVMKASELRVGNWVRCKIYNGTKDVILPFTWQESKYIHLFEPIPLTPEILEKCGFEVRTYKTNGVEKTHYSDSRNICIDHVLKKVFVLGLHQGYEDEVWIKKIEHLHQLQNLFFALTGEELNYQP